MLPTIPRPEHYDVSLVNGFLPTEAPLEILPDPYYLPWEHIVRNLQGLILSRRLRGLVNALPVLSTHFLHTEAEWRRAYSILAFISHAYIWGDARPAQVVPPTVSIPFLATCAHLDLPSVATYAAVALWNYKPLFADEPIDNLENLSTLTTFTGSIDESWFYLVSVAIEARAAPIVPIMLDAMAAARADDPRTVTAALQAFAERLDELATLLVRMYDSCDPHVFYHRIRPFLAGSKNMADAGLPDGVCFDDDSPAPPWVQLSGGSNAQSSIIQFFDLVLGIEHRPTGAAATAAHSAPSHNFIADMRRYMPGPHRRFLEAVAQCANVRPYVEARRGNAALATAYDACLAMLRAFRDKHIQIVSRYIILQSRETASAASNAHAAAGTPATHPLKQQQQQQQRRLNLATSSARVAAQPDRTKKLTGTGGTALIPFLKQARDETGEPAIGSWARRLLTNAPPGGWGGRGGVAPLGAVDEHANGRVEIVGLAGIWSLDDSEGGICHW